MQPTREPVFPTEEFVSAVRPRSSGEKVATVIGIKRCAQHADEQPCSDEPIETVDVAPIPFSADAGGWRERTLYLYDSLAPRLAGYLRNLGLKKDEREDVLQEVFLRLAGHLKKGNNEDNLHSWAHQVAHNLAMDVHRANRRSLDAIELKLESADEPADPKPNPEWVYLQKESSRRLSAALSQLTRQQFNSILLRIRGLRYREIGEHLGVSEQRAMHLVKRGMQRLKGGK